MFQLSPTQNKLLCALFLLNKRKKNPQENVLLVSFMQYVIVKGFYSTKRRAWNDKFLVRLITPHEYSAYIIIRVYLLQTFDLLAVAAYTLDLYFNMVWLRGGPELACLPFF